MTDSPTPGPLPRSGDLDVGAPTGTSEPRLEDSGRPRRGDRPGLLLVVAGTGTEVGKTWVARRLMEALGADGLVVAARKPVQSFEPTDPSTDADELAAATGEDPLVVCPAHRRYPRAMAPPMAADALGRPPIRLADLVAEVAESWAEPADVGLVELAGGVRSPLAHDGDGVDLILALRPDVLVVVADAGLGTINSVLTTLDALDAGGAPVCTGPVVHLNRYDGDDDLHRRNRDFLDGRLGRPVTTSIGALAAAIGAAAGPAVRA